MTSPIKTRKVRCPDCGDVYETQYRGSINVDLDPEMDEAYVEEMTTGTCLRCGRKVALGGLVVRGGVWEVG
jgi:DNA-directed RNA polymerase subunit RPC12/RpoP